MMGIGKRFLDAGYTEDKPFIKANGKLIIQLVAEPLLNKYGVVHIACRKEQADRLSKVLSEHNVVTHILEDSKGAGDTIRQVCMNINNQEQVLCVDSDTILTEEALNKIPTTGNAILSFFDRERTGMYSYLDVCGSVITNIQEKKPISDVANAGVYVFESTSVIINNYKETNESEQYLSHVVSNAISNGYIFESIDVTNQFECVGTPHQLQSYSKREPLIGKVFCFDLDMTLVYDLFKNPRPIQKNVDYCNYLYNNGAKIIIHTARGMLSKNRDTDIIRSTIVPEIEKILKDCGIKYDELIIGKPYADYYIDDKAISSYKDLQKETGVYYSIDNDVRQHHSIDIQDNCVIKKGNLENENHYYNNLPSILLEEYFPKIIHTSDTEICLERIKDSTFSNLYISGKLTEAHLLDLLNRLYVLHNHTDVPCTDWAYTTKVLDRFIQNMSFYEKLGITLSDILNLIDSEFQTDGSIIHGDPVFTNVFSNGKFIDPRGNWDGIPSIYGDRHYDYAKVLQSIIGYDFALKNIDVEYIYVGNLYKTFVDWYTRHYPKRTMTQLKRITKTMMISMLPLHKEDMNRCKRFLNVINNAL